jgi:hypothetical protein
LCLLPFRNPKSAIRNSPGIPHSAFAQAAAPPQPAAALLDSPAPSPEPLASTFSDFFSKIDHFYRPVFARKSNGH